MWFVASCDACARKRPGDGPHDWSHCSTASFFDPSQRQSRATSQCGPRSTPEGSRSGWNGLRRVTNRQNRSALDPSQNARQMLRDHVGTDHDRHPRSVIQLHSRAVERSPAVVVELTRYAARDLRRWFCGVLPGLPRVDEPSPAGGKGGAALGRAAAPSPPAPGRCRAPWCRRGASTRLWTVTPDNTRDRRVR